MKPKNRIYCASSGRSKLLFATEKKALTYVKFNYDEILQENGVAPIRAYYCECCMGWHTTHIMEGSHIEQRIPLKIIPEDWNQLLPNVIF